MKIIYKIFLGREAYKWGGQGLVTTLRHHFEVKKVLLDLGAVGLKGAGLELI